MGNNALATKAKKHVEYVEENFRKDVSCCVDNTREYSSDVDTTVRENPNYETRIDLVDSTSEDAIFEFYDGRTAVLNFASYKEPGGRFLKGSRAQEEMLCHSSTLYNVLRKFLTTFYTSNHDKLNKGFYNSNLLYSPKVIFFKGKQAKYCDVITCAAPNRYTLDRRGDITNEMLEEVLIDRIDHILFSAYDNKVDTLILGAFGCGAFRNSPRQVCRIFKNLLEGKYSGCFKNVIFAIPKGPNYITFRKVLRNGEEDSICL